MEAASGTARRTPRWVNPYRHEGLLARAWPFLAATAVGFALLPVSQGHIDPLEVSLAAVVVGLIALAMYFVPWDRLPRTASVLPPLAYFIVVALLRDASGGSASGYASLVLLPVLWVTLYGERPDLIAVLAGVWATFVIPILVDRGHYPESDWRFAVLITLLSAFIGFAAQGLVDSVRQRAEEAARSAQRMRQSEEYLRAVMTSTAEGIITLTPEGEGSFINPSAARMLGYTPDELRGVVLHEMIHHSHADGTHYSRRDCPIRRTILHGEACQVGDEVLWRKDGTSFPVIYQSTPILYEDGGRGGVVMTFTDITDRREVERLKDEFVSVVGHELRTPLTSIRGSLGLMAGGVLGDLDDQRPADGRHRGVQQRPARRG